MRTVKIGEVEHTLDCNGLTPFYYSEMFLVNRNGRMVCEDINDAVFEVYDHLLAGQIPPMLKLQQIMWAFEKTANPDIAPFMEWAKELPPSTLALTPKGGWSEAVVDMITEFFLPSQASEDVGAEPEREPAPTSAT